MAQQTINVGTAPNDGTGTPLRTAFQYTNSNFSELYTAVGPNGNNIVVPGNATITGDLTVDTSTLKVDSVNNRVGIGTASPANQLSVRNEGASGIAVIDVRGGSAGAGAVQISGNATTLGTTSFDLLQNSSGAFVNQRDANPLSMFVNGSERYAISSSGVATWSNVGGVAGTAMTLNANGLGVGVASPVTRLQANKAGQTPGGVSGPNGALVISDTSNTNVVLELGTNSAAIPYIQSRHISSYGFYDLVLQPTSGNVGIGVTPSAKLDVNGTVIIRDTFSLLMGFGNQQRILAGGGSDNTYLTFSQWTGAAYTERMRIDPSGNVGIGVTPSAWGGSYKALQLQSVARNIAATGAGLGDFTIAFNAIYDSTDSRWEYAGTGDKAGRYSQTGSGNHRWFVSNTAGTAGNEITDFASPAMTLDASGNLLVGTTSGSNSRFVKAVAAGTTVLEVTGAAGYGSYFNSGDAQGSSSALSIANIGRVVSTGRSINAGGTINASGADYAEYMTKASDFVLSKGDVAGIDANGKLTNVFADAVSFVVKSTDPSYVGNDKWGVGLEGDALESARQLVDRIAFAGQVPVNVTGAKAGDYIVPVVDGTGIKGIAVSNPTFEQYQLAVGKVIAIDADGRARIIVKVA